jgi:hypothetical protein
VGPKFATANSTRKVARCTQHVARTKRVRQRSEHASSFIPPERCVPCGGFGRPFDDDVAKPPHNDTMQGRDIVLHPGHQHGLPAFHMITGYGLPVLTRRFWVPPTGKSSVGADGGWADHMMGNLPVLTPRFHINSEWSHS